MFDLCVFMTAGDTDAFGSNVFMNVADADVLRCRCDSMNSRCRSFRKTMWTQQNIISSGSGAACLLLLLGFSCWASRGRCSGWRAAAAALCCWCRCRCFFLFFYQGPCIVDFVLAKSTAMCVREYVSPPRVHKVFHDFWKVFGGCARGSSVLAVRFPVITTACFSISMAVAAFAQWGKRD